MWIYANPNPEQKDVPDCVIRAISIALNKPWEEVFIELSTMAYFCHSIISHNYVWGKYLYWLGFIPFMIPNICPECITIKIFSEIFDKGTYIIGTGSHAVAVIDGNYYDTWDSGDEQPSFFWKIV